MDQGYSFSSRCVRKATGKELRNTSQRVTEVSLLK